MRKEKWLHLENGWASGKPELEDILKTISKNINKIAEDKKQTEDIASILKLSPSRRNQKYFKKSLVSK